MVIIPSSPESSSAYWKTPLLKSTFVSSSLVFTRFDDLLLRCRELETWTHDLALPAVVWLAGFFSPQSFLTGKAPLALLPSAHAGASTAEERE